MRVAAGKSRAAFFMESLIMKAQGRSSGSAAMPGRVRVCRYGNGRAAKKQALIRSLACQSYVIWKSVRALMEDNRAVSNKAPRSHLANSVEMECSTDEMTAEQ